LTEARELIRVGELNQGAKNMEAKGFVVPPGGGAVWDMEPGRSAALKLVGGQTAESVMLFEETAPPGTATDFHLHHDSDEVAYVLSGEITFLIGDKVTVGGPGSCAFMPRTVPHDRGRHHRPDRRGAGLAAAQCTRRDLRLVEEKARPHGRGREGCRRERVYRIAG
jgi:mannose-6-phosphate isomerase-like protein (cupin superfamily)